MERRNGIAPHFARASHAAPTDPSACSNGRLSEATCSAEAACGIRAIRPAPTRNNNSHQAAIVQNTGQKRPMPVVEPEGLVQRPNWGPLTVIWVR